MKLILQALIFIEKQLLPPGRTFVAVVKCSFCVLSSNKVIMQGQTIHFH